MNEYWAYLESLPNYKVKLGVLRVNQNIPRSHNKDYLPTDIFGLQGGGAFVEIRARTIQQAKQIASRELSRDMERLRVRPRYNPPKAWKSRNTRTRTEGAEFIVRYHSTDVFKFKESTGVVTLNSGGWHTATTMRRMNQAAFEFGLAFKVKQIDFAWYVVFSSGRAVAFEDGMQIAV